MKGSLFNWHRRFILCWVLDMVDEHGHPDTRELVICETVERRWHLGRWEYRWPE